MQSYNRIEDLKIQKGADFVKKSFRIIVSMLLVLAVGFVFATGVAYAYYGRYHKVLYDVQTVYVTADEEENDLFHLKFDVKAKNWFFNFKTYDCELLTKIEGGPDYNFTDDNIPNFKLNNRGVTFEKECSLKLNIPDFDIKKADDKLSLENTILSLDFIPREINNQFPFDEIDARLFMNDNKDAEIVYRIS